MEEKIETVKTEGSKPLLRLGETAPDFEAVTTQGRIKLSGFTGNWVILFSHPADFTPVCTTEFMAFARINEELAKKECQTDRTQHRQCILTHCLDHTNKGETRSPNPLSGNSRSRHESCQSLSDDSPRRKHNLNSEMCLRD